MKNIKLTWADLAKAHGLQAIEDYLKTKQIL
jgi:hypothetical protein